MNTLRAQHDPETLWSSFDSPLIKDFVAVLQLHYGGVVYKLPVIAVPETDISVDGKNNVPNLSIRIPIVEHLNISKGFCTKRNK